MSAFAERLNHTITTLSLILSLLVAGGCTLFVHSLFNSFSPVTAGAMLILVPLVLVFASIAMAATQLSVTLSRNVREFSLALLLFSALVLLVILCLWLISIQLWPASLLLIALLALGLVAEEELHARRQPRS